MRRPPPRDTPPERRPRKEPTRPEGPFDRLLRKRPERDPAPFIIGGTIFFLGLVIVLVFVISSVLGGDDDDGGPSVQVAEGVNARLVRLPELRPGLKAVSDFVEFETEGDVPSLIQIQLPLLERVDDPEGLGFYTFTNGRWQRVSNVELVDEATQLGKGDFSPLPANLAILRVVSRTFQVVGSLPSRNTLHPEGQVDVLSPRDYVPAADGSVLGSATDVGGDPNVSVMPTIVGSSADTGAVVDDILASESLLAAHVQAIVSLVVEGGFDGIDLEYSLVDPGLSQEFTDFVTALSQALAAEGPLGVSITVPPPTGQRQAYEWEALGQVVEMIRVLPIADPVDYWETMPEALDEIAQSVAPQKVVLVISPFSVERIGDVSRPIGYVEAMVLAGEIAVQEPTDPLEVVPGVSVKAVAINMAESEGASPLKWSDQAGIMTFSFGGAQGRTIFVENLFSVRFKLELAETYGLGGVVVADASAQSDVANVWPAVTELAEAASVTLLRPSNENLLPVWGAPDGGVLEVGAGTTATWRAPAEAGQYTLEFEVSDGERLFGRKITVEVAGPPEASPTPFATPFGPTATPTPEPTGTPTPEPTDTPVAGDLAVEVGKLADGDDPDTTFSNQELTSAGSSIVYLITIDNDSAVEVTVISLLDDVYPEMECLDTTQVNVVDQVLAPDDGDGLLGEAVFDGGPDELQCFFTEIAPGDPGIPTTDIITLVVEDSDGRQATDQDDATVTTVIVEG
jgi:hypothetical protein